MSVSEGLHRASLDSSEVKQESPWKRRIATFTLAAIGAIGTAGAFVAFTEIIPTIEDENSELHDKNMELEHENNILDVLAEDGVRHLGVSFRDSDNQALVTLPTDNPTCKPVAFEYTTKGGEWVLSLPQTDAAGAEYDTARIRNAEAARAMINDLCS